MPESLRISGILCFSMNFFIFISLPKFKLLHVNELNISKMLFVGIVVVVLSLVVIKTIPNFFQKKDHSKENNISRAIRLVSLKL